MLRFFIVINSVPLVRDQVRKTIILVVFAGSVLLSACGANAISTVSPVRTLAPPLVIIKTVTPSKPTITATLQQVIPTVSQTLEKTIAPPATSQAKELVEKTDNPLGVFTAVPTDEDGLPKSHYIYGITGHKQYFPLGCEAAVTKDWASYFGVEINEFEFQYKLPLSDNPEVGFVGSVTSKWGQAPPYAYGVHAGPVAQLLQEYDVPATAVKNYSLTSLKKELAADRPVIAWVIGNVVGGIPYEYTAKDGQKVIVAAYEHVIIVTGYNDTHIRYNSNGKFYDVPVKVFLNSWGVLGNMALIAGE
jgi:uncharacterized protein YvpB